MKKILLLLFSILALTSCQKPFTMPVDLAVNDEIITLSPSGGSCNIAVYSNQTWSAALSEDASSWGSIKVNNEEGLLSAEGIGQVSFTYEANDTGSVREAEIVLSGADKTISITLKQGVVK